MAPANPRISAAIVALLLCLGAAAPARVAARKLRAASEPPAQPLIVKALGCFSPNFRDVATRLAADVAAVDTYAAANGRQRLTYAGTVSNLTAELGSFNMLIVYTASCNWAVSAEVFSANEQAAVQTALATGTLKKLMVWHAYNRANVDNRVPGISNVGCSNFNFPYLPWITANPDLYANVGPNSPSSKETLYGDYASLGACPASGIQRLNNSVAHAWDRHDKARITAFGHCYQGGRGAVFYSQTPIDGYLDFRIPPLLFGFHANAISVFSNDINCASPPTCPADVVLSDTWLPPNNKMFDVSLTSVPLQDPALPGNVTVNSVEFFDVLKGRRPTFPLAVMSAMSPSVVSLRAQRNAAGSGRLYRIKYTAANAAGSCDGVAFVCVPHDASAFDPLVNATTIADLAAAGLTTPPEAAAKVACPIPSSIAEAAWMPTTTGR